MLPRRSIAAHAPALDRNVLRAILSRSGPWARRPQELAAQIAELLDRPRGCWVPQPEDALLAALAARTTPLHLAVPAFGHPGFEGTRLRAETRVHWMEPAHGRLDPGPSEVAQALDAGANAVLLTPLAGDCSALPEAAGLCTARGALLAVDARASMASRVLDGGPAAWGDVCLVPVDGEGGPSPCPGAILLGGDGGDAQDGGGPQPGLLIRLVATSLRDEPHLRRLLGPSGASRLEPDRRRAPSGWAVAAASARALQSGQRNTQRARHARTLQVHCSHLAAVRVPEPISGHQAAGLAVPMLASGRDEVVQLLAELGLEVVHGLGAWLAPPDSRGPRAQQVADRLLAVPLHPFYVPGDIDWLAECLRKATLRVNGEGSADPTEAVVYAAKAAFEL